MQYYDYETVAIEAGVSQSDLAKIAEQMRCEFPTDDMMWELHILRACSAVKEGRVTVDQIIDRQAA